MSGHIRPPGKGAWELKFDVRSDTGERKTRYATVHGGKREAQRKLTELLDQANKVTLLEPSKETVAQFLERWLRDWAAINVSPKTGERYGQLVRTYAAPYVGAVQLQKLSGAHLGELYALLMRTEDVRRPLAPRTVGHVHRVLHKALAVAGEWGLISGNPADRVKPPRVDEVEIEILSEAQIGQMLARFRDEPLYPLVALALGTGMRRGELLALSWGNIDLDANRVRVDRSLEQTRQALRFKSPKTRNGRRSISLPASIAGDLRSYRIAQQELWLKLGAGKITDETLVFPDIHGQPRKPDAVTKAWRRSLARLRLPPVSLHALRHTHASQLIASGMDVLTISRRLGHASPTVTLGVYGHLFENTDDRAAQVIEAAIVRAKTE
jgi:integrase